MDQSLPKSLSCETPGTTTIKLVYDLEIKMNERIDKVCETFNEKLNNKVSFSTFTWVLGILLVIVLGVQGIIWKRLEDISTKTGETRDTAISIQAEQRSINKALDRLELTK